MVMLGILALVVLELLLVLVPVLELSVLALVGVWVNGKRAS